MQTMNGKYLPVSLVQTYVFGRHFTIKSDHKSLEQISMKNLADAPVCLQRMLLWLQDYDFTIKYRPGNEMVVADTLSRYSPEDTSEILLDISLNHVYINPEKKWDYQLAIQDDPLLHALADIILAGWPDNIKDVPKALRPYHGQCDSLTVEDGLILRGEAIIVFPGERRKILEQGHLGISKCQNRARQCVYWPGINKDIEQLVEACPTCQRHRPQEPRQPLKPTPLPDRAWQHLGADFMSFDRSEYLVIVNYYSKMPIVWKMPTSQCSKNHHAPQGVICRTWNSRIHQVRQWIPVLQSPVQGVYRRVELHSSHKFPYQPSQQWTGWVSSQDHQRSAHQIEVCRRRCISRTLGLQKYTCWFTPKIT